MRLRCLVAAVTVIAASLAAKASTITLTSDNNGVYIYGLDNDANGEVFNPGQSVVLSGLFGVTGASFGNDGFQGTVSFTSTSATFTENANSSDAYPDPGTFANLLRITSTSLTTGSVSFAINASPSSSGQVLGPVAAATVTPEPSSIALLGTGLLGVVGVVKRRFA